jgi:predicted aspartyl protease
MRQSQSPRLVGLAAVVAGLTIGCGIGCTDPRRPASSSAAADSAAGEVGFRWAGPGGAALVVSARVNGRAPVDLILDTGATLTCVDTSLVRELALPEQRTILGAAVSIRGAGRVRLYSVDSLQVGAAVARGLTVCALDLRALRPVSPEVRGLLGLNFLRSFRVTLDFERDILRLAPPGE